MEFLKIWEILLRRKWYIIIIFIGFFITGVVGTNLITPTYKASTKLLMESSDTVSSLMSNLDLQFDNAPISVSSSDDYDTDISLATVRPLIEELIASLELRDQKGKLMDPDALVKSGLASKLFPRPNIKVEQYEDADILEVISISPDASQAAEMSNKLAELFIKASLLRTKEEYRAARIFIEDQIVEVKKNYYRSLSDIKDFMIKEDSIDLGLESQNMISKISSLNDSYEENEKKILEMENEIIKIKEQLKDRKSFRKSSEDFTRSDQLISLEGKIDELLINIAGVSVDLHQEHPDYLQLEKELETAKELIKDKAEVVLRNETFSIDPIFEDLSEKLVESIIEKEISIARRRLLKGYINKYQKELMQIPIKRVEYSKLELALNINKDMYQALLEYAMQVGIAESMTLSNIRVVESAITPEKINSPNKEINYIIAFLMGIFWALGAAFFIEYIDNTIKTPNEIKHIEGITFLGSIPRTKLLKKEKVISNLAPTSPVVEAYRTIKNSIEYSFIDRPLKTIMVTSSIDNEGKTSTACNLAITFSLEGKKVIFVELDLRRPTIKDFFNIPKEAKGITNALAEGLDLKEIIIPTSIEGFSIIASGPTPPDPSRLIGSQRLKDIIASLEETFDVVIVDTPPVMPVNDSIVIGTFTDGVVYVTEAGRTTFSMVEHSKELMKNARVNLIGVIMNKFKAQATSYYHYYNRYYYKK